MQHLGSYLFFYVVLGAFLPQQQMLQSLSVEFL